MLNTMDVFHNPLKSSCILLLKLLNVMRHAIFQILYALLWRPIIQREGRGGGGGNSLAFVFIGMANEGTC